MTDQVTLEDLHRILAETLLERIRDPEAKASDLNVARQFLKDNHIDSLPTKGSPLGALAESLPNFSDDEADISEMMRH
jgi:hypothetical protein